MAPLAASSRTTLPCSCSPNIVARQLRAPRQIRAVRVHAGEQAGGALNSIFGGNQQKQGAQAGQQLQQPVGTPDSPELPPYAVIQKQGEAGAGFDIRMYQAYAVVEIEYQRREEGYLALGDYLGGANATKSKFGFTAPVVMRYQPDGKKVMQMMVGTQRNWQHLPEEQRAHKNGSSRPDPRLLPAPTNPAVRIGVAGAEMVAVLAFEGFITPETAAWARQRLVQLLETDGRFKLAEEEEDGLFRVGQYGAVHTLDTRINEMMLAVDFLN